MLIRKALQSDAKSISDCLFIAMDDILKTFVESSDPEVAKKFLLQFIEQRQNQYSWENCHVGEFDNEIVCAINIYRGADLQMLRQPVVDFVQKHYNADFSPEYETQIGEYYIDSFGVNPDHQGRGFGSTMLQQMIQKYVIENKQTLGLLVDIDNPNAKKLYSKLGFEPVGFKTLAGKTLEHLQIS